MFAWKRPGSPSDFADLVRRGRVFVACAIRHGGQPFGPVFDDTWNKLREAYKPIFERAQQRRCAWCDRCCTGFGMLDHLRPKAEVARVDPAHPGRELDGTGKIDEKFRRKKLAYSERGYWWLAFRWSNFVYSCELCNSTWKRSFFACSTDSLEGSLLPSPCPSDARSEKALLLDPYALPPLSQHLCFSANGSVKGTTPQGKATVEIVALDRPSLRTIRGDFLGNIERSCDAYEFNLQQWLNENATSDPPSRLAVLLLGNAVKALEDALRAGEERRELAGVSRCFLEHKLGDPYEQLCAFRDELRALYQDLLSL